MRLSCLPVSLFSDIIEGRLSIAEFAGLAAELGLDGVDLSTVLIPDRTSAAVETLRSHIESAGMRVAMLTSYPDFTHPDAAQRERELALAQQVMAVAACLGADLVRVTAGQAHPETGREEGIGWAVNGLSRLVETTRGMGVIPVYENHAKPGVWTHTDFSQPPDVFLEIVERTAGVGLGVNFDTGNAASFADDPLELLECVLDRVVSVHAADTAARGRQQPVLLGTGITPFDAIFRRLNRAGWDGWICIEEVSYRGREGVAAATRFVRQAWLEATVEA
jgi:sugar phosphate isomerase/epimerase